MMTREVRTIRQKIDKRTSEALSQPWEARIFVEAVGNSIHYFPGSLKGSGKHTLSCIISPCGGRRGQEGLSSFHSRKAETFLFRRRTRPHLNGETNRRWRRDTPCNDAKRWPRNNNMATASGGVKRSPRYQLIE